LSPLAAVFGTDGLQDYLKNRVETPFLPFFLYLGQILT